MDRKKLVLIGCLSMAAAGYIAFYFFLNPHINNIFIFSALLAIGASIINGCYPLLMAELFPANVRYSGMAISYNLGVALFGGLGPMIFTLISKEFHSTSVIFYYLLINILMTAMALSQMPKISNDNQSNHRNGACQTPYETFSI